MSAEAWAIFEVIWNIVGILAALVVTGLFAAILFGLFRMLLDD